MLTYACGHVGGSAAVDVQFWVKLDARKPHFKIIKIEIKHAAYPDIYVRCFQRLITLWESVAFAREKGKAPKKNTCRSHKEPAGK